MKPLYTQEEYKSAKSRDLLSCECYECNKPFNVLKYKITVFLSTQRPAPKYCSNSCRNKALSKKQFVNCLFCNIQFEKKASEIIRNPKHLCTRSCATKYIHKNKTTGYRRSKLEIWLEEQLTILYPELIIDFNKKTGINSELDIYIPSLNLAFELNGIVHYEPIYGIDKLNYVKSNDLSKSLACHNAKIDLCIIDVSQQKYVKPSTSQKYLDIITNIINERFKK